MPLPIVAVAANVLPGLFGLVDQLFTSDAERAEAKRKLVELEQQGQLAQIAVNLEEAKHESIFVAGGRPFIIWVCGFAFAYSFILRDFIILLLFFLAPEFDLTLIPQPDLATMMPVLLGILGLGGMRTFEKYTGTNTNRGGIPYVPTKQNNSAFPR